MVDDAVLERERAHARPLARVRGRVGSAHGREPATGPSPPLCWPARHCARRLAPVVVFDASSRCCSSVNETLKSELKSLPNEDAQGNVHPIRRLYACSFASGARDTAAKRDVVVRQVDDEAVEPVRDRRAGRTPRRVVGPEHEVVDEELRAPSEEVCQRGAPFVGLEAVLLVDPDPRQLLPPPRQLVAAPRELLLRLEQLEPRCKPLFYAFPVVCLVIALCSFVRAVHLTPCRYLDPT